jgi:hypothetical protein
VLGGRTRRILFVALVAVAAAVGARVAAPAPERHAGFSAPLACGYDRWSIKTLKDRPQLYPPQEMTIAHLVRLPRPKPFPPPERQSLEHHIYTVVAEVTAIRPEIDGDNHVFLRSGSFTMLAETPSWLCTEGATALRRKQMKNSRAVARVCAKARVTGVAFWDYQYWLRGAARNAIELHPVLDFACLTPSK